MTRTYSISLKPGEMPRDVDGVPDIKGSLTLNSVTRTLTEEQFKWLQSKRPDLVARLNVTVNVVRAPKGKESLLTGTQASQVITDDVVTELPAPTALKAAPVKKTAPAAAKPPAPAKQSE